MRVMVGVKVGVKDGVKGVCGEGWHSLVAHLELLRVGVVERDEHLGLVSRVTLRRGEGMSHELVGSNAVASSK